MAASMPDTIAGARVCVWTDKHRIVEVSLTTLGAQLSEALREAAPQERPVPVRGLFSIPASPATTVHGIGDMARQVRRPDGTVRVELLRGQCFVSLEDVGRDKKDPDAATTGPQTRALAFADRPQTRRRPRVCLGQRPPLPGNSTAGTKRQGHGGCSSMRPRG